MKSAILLIAFALGAVGAATGYSVGLSQTPVVATLLPLLFGLIAGGSGFLLTGMDLTDQDTRKKTTPALIGIFVFSATYLVAMGHGISLRIPAKVALDSVDLENLSLAENAQLIAYRQSLVAGGAKKSEQEAVLKGYAERLNNGSGNFADPVRQCAEIRDSTKAFISALGMISSEDYLDEDQSLNTEALALELSGLYSALSFCDDSDFAESKHKLLTFDFVRKTVFSVLESEVINADRYYSADSPWSRLATSPEAPESFFRLYLRVMPDSKSPAGELKQWSEMSDFVQKFAAGTSGRSLASTDEMSFLDGSPS